MRYPTPAYWRCQVWTVRLRLDGDSLTEVYRDLGSDRYELVAVRLKDVLAPEMSQVGGRECRDFVLGWLAEHHDGTDWPFMLETFRTPRSDRDLLTLGRYVGVVRAADGASLNAEVQAFVRANGYDGGVGS